MGACPPAGGPWITGFSVVDTVDFNLSRPFNFSYLLVGKSELHQIAVCEREAALEVAEDAAVAASDGAGRVVERRGGAAAETARETLAELAPPDCALAAELNGAQFADTLRLLQRLSWAAAAGALGAVGQVSL